MRRKRQGCIALEAVVVHHTDLAEEEAHRIGPLVEAAVGQREFGHMACEPHNLVAVETGTVRWVVWVSHIVPLVDTVLVVESHIVLEEEIAVRKVGFLHMVTAGVAAVGGVGCHIAD